MDSFAFACHDCFGNSIVSRCTKCIQKDALHDIDRYFLPSTCRILFCDLAITLVIHIQTGVDPNIQEKGGGGGTSDVCIYESGKVSNPSQNKFDSQTPPPSPFILFQPCFEKVDNDCMEYIHSYMDYIYSCMEHFHLCMECINTCMECIHTCMECIHSCMSLYSASGIKICFC